MVIASDILDLILTNMGETHKSIITLVMSITLFCIFPAKNIGHCCQQCYLSIDIHSSLNIDSTILPQGQDWTTWGISQIDHTVKVYHLNDILYRVFRDTSVVRAVCIQHVWRDCGGYSCFGSNNCCLWTARGRKGWWRRGKV